MNEYKQLMAKNRNTLYHFFKDNEFQLRFTKIGKGSYKVFIPPYDWDSSYLLINDVRITDFEAVILFTNELVVRFDTFTNRQINIPYRIIEKIGVTDEVALGYQELHMNS